MNTLNRVVRKKDYELFLKGEDNLINNIWNEILDSLSKELKQEALKKGFKLELLDQQMDLLNLKLIVEDASDELELAILHRSPFIICE